MVTYYKENKMLIQSKFQRQLQTRHGNPPDSLLLDSNEKATLERAHILGLGDKITREKLYNEALEGTITPFQIEQIKEVQKGLKEDGKYKGEIDGKFGPESTQALKEMVNENDLLIDAKRYMGSLDIEEQKESDLNYNSVLSGKANEPRTK